MAAYAALVSVMHTIEQIQLHPSPPISLDEKTAKSERTPQHWKYIAENLNPIVNLEDDARCLKILSMSYFNLPVHLKPCFLYMGVYPEDMDIPVSLVVRLWVAEGFLKPISGKCLEEVAEDYLKHLIDRNLISVHRWGYSGKIKSCKIHDLLRDLCLREAQKEKFICAPRVHSSSMLQSPNTERCITLVINKGNRKQAFALPEIWMMPHLRHVELRSFFFPDPPRVEKDKPVFVLRNLQTLLEVLIFKCGEDVIKRIPNIKKLKLFYVHVDEALRECKLNNLEAHLPTFSQEVDFKGNISRLGRDVEQGRIIALLQVLKLKDNSCKGPEWKPVEGQFCSLRYLLIDHCDDLDYWTADETNFPLLEQLVLRELNKLTEIPLGVGDIPTLRSIELHGCCYSAMISAKEIPDQQDEFGNMDLQVHAFIGVEYWNGEEYKILRSLESRNFQVESRSYTFMVRTEFAIIDFKSIIF
ncbi:hypothetical protein BUALT_Bualt07G0162900 [Buddleja alternifolia]|uniref:Disease resistance protein winged helix domain-containing protein n=1 Tax=Buddleja alternifolia TaxID=168488 RepID=A0AAV6XCG7_9LAMI|nr:hypothetical protein BUALT_Bualt07G0162900 [Buddleja alternifolia]